jgi:uncharacterized SAM-binding protein YcdF (DUF218 family)
MRSIVNWFLSPLVIFWLLIAVAYYFRLIFRKKLSKTFILLAIIVLAVGSTPIVIEPLLLHLENQYAYFSIENYPELRKNDSTHIVVLAAGYTPDIRLVSSIAMLDPISMVRLTEAIRIHRQLPSSRIVCSGGPAKGDMLSQAVHTARAAADLGVDPQLLDILPVPGNTFEEAEAYRLFAVKPVQTILVTSASHMPRAMLYFTSAGFDPIPAPTDYKTKENPYANEWHIPPSIRYLQFWEIALHEYIGLLWASINQRG